MSLREAKTAATRRKLTDATFDALVEGGYHGTSAAAVCRRAELARGTMLHHFPNKEALVLAALEDVLARRVEDFRVELSQAPNTDLEALVLHLWRAVKGPTFFVWLELTVASRTIPTLNAELRLVMARFDALVVATAASLVSPALLGGRDLKASVSLVFSALNGMALDLLQTDPDTVEERVAMLARTVAQAGRPKA